MQKSEQVSPYFLYDLERFRIFVELSARHWIEESIKYDQSDIETDERTCWDRYKYRTDLSAHFNEIFPKYQKQSYFLMLVSLFEDYLNQLCNSLHFENKFCCSLKEYNGSGIERAKKYLLKIARISVPTETTGWSRIIDARDIRNIIAHNAGHLDQESNNKQMKIVSKSQHLNSEQYARIHLNIENEYLFEVIGEMEEVAKVLSGNIRVNA
ncbi:hypothetical protein [Pseudoalteromonas ruthenica]|uniref:hypothetical protein n=1 Tax=Pseudoalteromonas ruthenica TaxID=151081 RepID=UPI00241CC103|nr:hypothetical protein [Pseudoalteromonas ruthenica]|tara:strand:- start:32585 stop:33217 length:633 start_codon:yes stop_codon:yes gene_type:complete